MENFLTKFSLLQSNGGTNGSLPSPKTQQKLKNNKALALKLEKLRKQNSVRLDRAKSLLSLDNLSTNSKENATLHGSTITEVETEESASQASLSKSKDHSFRTNSKKQQQEEKQKELEDECTRLREEIATTKQELIDLNKSWETKWDQEHARFQEEIFHYQRQAELTSNSLLSKEFDDLCKLQERVSDQLKSQEPTMMKQKVESLQKDVKEWQDRYLTEESKWEADRIELEDQVQLYQKELQEAKRQILFLEEELETIAFEEEEKYHHDTDDEDSTSSSYHYNSQMNNPYNRQEERILLLQTQRAQLEEKLESLMMENAALQKKLRSTKKVQDLEQQWKEFKEQKEIEEREHYRQVLEWKEQAQVYQRQLSSVQEQLDLINETRDSYRTEWVRRIEKLEAENYELRLYKQNRQIELEHERNLHKRMMERLKAQLATSSRRETHLREQMLTNGSNTNTSHQLFPTHKFWADNTVATEITVSSKEDDVASPVGDHDDINNNNSESTKNNENNEDKEKIRHLEALLTKARVRERSLSHRLEVASKTVEKAQKRAAEAEEEAELIKRFMEDQMNDDNNDGENDEGSSGKKINGEHHDEENADPGHKNTMDSNGNANQNKVNTSYSSLSGDQLAASMHEKIASETAKLSTRRSQVLQRLRDCQEQIEKDTKSVASVNTSLLSREDSTVASGEYLF